MTHEQETMNDKFFKEFSYHFSVTSAFSTLETASLQDAGVTVIEKARASEDDDGRKWACVIGGAKSIIAGGKEGWICYNWHRELFISRAYSETVFWKTVNDRIEAFIARIMTDGYPMMGICNIFDVAVEDSEKALRYFTSMEKVFQ